MPADGVGIRDDGGTAAREGAAMIDVEISRERITAEPASARGDHRRDAALATGEATPQRLTQ
jgi:hypothetical protein